VTQLLHQAPSEHGIARTRWRLQDIQQTVSWLTTKSIAAVCQTMSRFGLSRRQVLRFVHSPDPEYHSKWQAIEQAQQQAADQPQQVTLLYGDEVTYYRSPTAAPVYHEQGQRQPRIYQHPGPNTQTRLLGALDAMTGRVLYLQRSTVGMEALIAFAPQLRQAYPDTPTVYLVLDNWPVHKLPEVLAAFAKAQITLLFLPTYASWLNPIEKLWRYLRQQVLHAHPHAAQLAQLRQEVRNCLDRFVDGSHFLLRYVGLLLD
jgi:transposase